MRRQRNLRLGESCVECGQISLDMGKLIPSLYFSYIIYIFELSVIQLLMMIRHSQFDGFRLKKLVLIRTNLI